jgi:hypothetical protein
MTSKALVKTTVALPVVIDEATGILDKLTAALGVPRTVLAGADEISHAWTELPRLLERIPVELRDVNHVRMCVAVSAGLFDSAINYVWNSSILELRNKVRTFGVHLVPQITGKAFDEAALIDLKDAELLELCLNLNLIDEDAAFFLDQSRDVRNNFSSAHPPIGTVDDHEFLAFLSRCVKYALDGKQNPKGVETSAFLGALKGGKFTDHQRGEWTDRLASTHLSQRNTLIGMLHGIYCDPASTEETRLNALTICQHFAPEFPPSLKSDLVNRHSDYVAENKPDRHKASMLFFERTGLLGLLSQPERHRMFSQACRRLMSVHLEMNNFYNEPPFAARLLELSSQTAIPETAQYEFVHAVATCATGRPSGVSHAAMPSYEQMIKNFSPQEIRILLEAPKQPGRLGERVKTDAGCSKRFRSLVALIDPASVAPQVQRLYKQWTT